MKKKIEKQSKQWRWTVCRGFEARRENNRQCIKHDLIFAWISKKCFSEFRREFHSKISILQILLTVEVYLKNTKAVEMCQQKHQHKFYTC